MKELSNIFRALRIKDWIKNVVIFFPVIFSGKILEFQINDYRFFLLNIFNFCLLTSIVYIFNDIQDKDYDSLNKYKKNRPIASGSLSTLNAYKASLFLLLLIIFNYLFFRLSFIEYYFLYFLNNIFYNFKVKRLNIVNSISISLGFLIRLFYGSQLGVVPLEPWLVSLVFLGSFLLSLIKKLSDKIMKTNTRDHLKLENKFINFSIISMITIYLLHFYISLEFSFTNQVISVLIFSTSLLIIKDNIKKISHSVDTIYILTSDKKFIFFIVLWFSHYYFVRYL